MIESQDKHVLIGILIGLGACLLIVVGIGIIDGTTYNYNDVAKGKMFEVRGNIYRCIRIEEKEAKGE